MSTLEPSGQIRKEEHGMDGFGIGKEHSDLLSDFRTKEKEKGEREESSAGLISCTSTLISDLQRGGESSL